MKAEMAEVMCRGLERMQGSALRRASLCLCYPLTVCLGSGSDLFNLECFGSKTACKVGVFLARVV